MFSSIYMLLRCGVELLPIFFKTILNGSNSIPRFYNAIYFLVICISDVIEFRFVSMSMLSSCAVVLEFLPLNLTYYVLGHHESGVCAFVDYVYVIFICYFVKLSMLYISGISQLLIYQVPICHYVFQSYR